MEKVSNMVPYQQAHEPILYSLHGQFLCEDIRLDEGLRLRREREARTQAGRRVVHHVEDDGEGA